MHCLLDLTIIQVVVGMISLPYMITYMMLWLWEEVSGVIRWIMEYRLGNGGTWSI